ncbi:MAG: glycosyltransferase family 2 protein [Actinobacteria bacterium]|nr:glycosyltransferase family 2 protein [Actinomycetota bacterium]MBW3646760.1 glycosyltransferase family 2 protein [Actinomycetota bacterium]
MTEAPASPLVSVLVPAYQEERTLERAIRSTLRQSMGNLEVLVVDDGSTDETLTVARALAAADPRVRVLPSPVNTGPAATRNRGLDAARGTWIALLDADDVWLPQRLEQLLAASADVDIVCDDVLLVDAIALERGEVTGVRVLPWLGLALTQPRLLELEEFIRYDLGYLKPVLRRSAVEQAQLRYRPELRVSEDFSFAVVALAKGLTWRQLPQPYYCYRRGEASLSSGPTTIARQQDEVVRSLLSVPQVAASPGAVCALRRHERRACAALAYHGVRAAAKGKDVRRLLALVQADPDVPWLLLEKAWRRAWLVGRRWQLRADRLPQDSVAAVREAWGPTGAHT